MACDRDYAHFIVFMHVCGYYSRAAINQGAASIRMNTAFLLYLVLLHNIEYMYTVYLQFCIIQAHGIWDDRT